MDTEKIMEGISAEMLVALSAMEKAETQEEKRIYSEIIKNLSSSLGELYHLISDMAGLYDEDESIPF